MPSVWDVVNLYLGALSLNDDDLSNSSFVNDTEACDNKLIEDTLFYQLALIPAFVILAVFSLTQKRRQLALNVLQGRPGLIFPVDMTTRSNRFSYACAFGSTAYLLVQCIFDNFRAFDYEGHVALKTAVILASVLIFGIVYFPVFACLTLGSIYSHGLGAAYVWMMTAVQVVRLVECEYHTETRLIIVLRSVPQVLCLLYLSLNIPLRFYRDMRRKSCCVRPLAEGFGDRHLTGIKASIQGKHVRELLEPRWRRVQRLQSKEKSCCEKVKDAALNATYRREPGFRYSAMILSTLLVGFIGLYSVAVRVFAFILVSYKLSSRLARAQTVSQFLGQEKEEAQALLEMSNTLLDYVFGAVVGGLSLATALGVYGILRMLVGYRQTMQRLYRGEMKDLTRDLTNAPLLVGALKFCGFQVTYVFWGFFFHSILFILLGGAVVIFIWLMVNGFTGWFIRLLERSWSILLWTILIYAVQTLLAKFVFLQKNTKLIAFTNRRALFVFFYFMFFYNVFLGVFSTLLRLVKSVVIGAVMLPRLDHSVLPAGFEQSDPGFQAYLGYMTVEMSQSHPVMLVFLRLCALGARGRHRWPHGGLEEIVTSGHPEKVKDGEVGSLKAVRERERKRQAAAFNWHILYTLINNPELRLHRKGYVSNMRRARELGIRVPVSDGVTVLGQDFLQQLEEAEGGGVEDVLTKAGAMMGKKAAVFKTKVLRKARHLVRKSSSFVPEPQVSGSVI
ncbi:receptor for retinol uptake stra6 [Aplysia californica]|uniref:Receptor for retinol uptake STRA6 n=1 Tax=Aplysia californica TaxID=6500 RepID=A0ABM1A0V7_APLCA|nr:receptor for retinol uptake stra6 [Aplysia californica]